MIWKKNFLFSLNVERYPTNGPNYNWKLRYILEEQQQSVHTGRMHPDHHYGVFIVALMFLFHCRLIDTVLVTFRHLHWDLELGWNWCSKKNVGTKTGICDRNTQCAFLQHNNETKEKVRPNSNSAAVVRILWQRSVPTIPTIFDPLPVNPSWKGRTRHSGSPFPNFNPSICTLCL